MGFFDRICMAVAFPNHHAGQGEWCLCRAELQQPLSGKREMLLTVLLHFPLITISSEAGCSASHKQSFQS